MSTETWSLTATVSAAKWGGWLGAVSRARLDWTVSVWTGFSLETSWTNRTVSAAQHDEEQLPDEILSINVFRKYFVNVWQVCLKMVHIMKIALSASKNIIDVL